MTLQSALERSEFSFGQFAKIVTANEISSSLAGLKAEGVIGEESKDFGAGCGCITAGDLKKLFGENQVEDRKTIGDDWDAEREKFVDGDAPPFFIGKADADFALADEPVFFCFRNAAGESDGVGEPGLADELFGAGTVRSFANHK